MIFQNQQNNQEKESVAELYSYLQNINYLTSYQEFRSLTAMIKHVQS